VTFVSCIIQQGSTTTCSVLVVHFVHGFHNGTRPRVLKQQLIITYAISNLYVTLETFNVISRRFISYDGTRTLQLNQRPLFQSTLGKIASEKSPAGAETNKGLGAKSLNAIQTCYFMRIVGCSLEAYDLSAISIQRIVGHSRFGIFVA